MESELPGMSGIMSFHVLAVPQTLLFQTPQLFLSWTPRLLRSTLIQQYHANAKQQYWTKSSELGIAKTTKALQISCLHLLVYNLYLCRIWCSPDLAHQDWQGLEHHVFVFWGCQRTPWITKTDLDALKLTCCFLATWRGGCCSLQNHSTCCLISWLAAGSNSRRDDWKIKTVQPALLQRACACVWKLRALKFMALLYMHFNLIVSSECVGVGGSFRQSHTVDGSPILDHWCITQWRNYQAPRVQDWTAHQRYIMRCHHVIRCPLNSKLCTLFPRPFAFAPLVAASAPQMPVIPSVFPTFLLLPSSIFMTYLFDGTGVITRTLALALVELCCYKNMSIYGIYG